MSRALVLVIVVLLALGISYAVHRRTARTRKYRCMNCGNIFRLSPLLATISPHRLGGRKYTSCPLCGARSWVTPVSTS
jgi:DNA-directed RNA polymerase subunit RPC12/RpoP